MLPTSLILTDDDLSGELLDKIVEEMNDYLSDKYGYCTEGYRYEIKIDIDGITWDTED